MPGEDDAKHRRSVNLKSREEGLAFRPEAASLEDVWLILDYEIVAQVSVGIRSAGRLLVCHGCSDLKALIVGLLLDDGEQLWPLCGSCIRQLPLHGAFS